ncbi:MAG: TonB-dependent receptor, partial [candidate division Zixibacteria bacterium]|nr:TonB-dependent receptor [candidate division Zixibacteria bacterium]
MFDFGLRGETWWPGDYLERAVADTTLPNITPAMRERFRANTFKLFGQRAEGWVSPRIGVSFAAGPSSSIFVSYGQFAQRPNPRYLYAKLQTRSPATFQLFGNPALKPERTVAIEGGVKLLRGQDWAFTLSLYQRDIHDYIAATAVIPDPDQPENFWYAYANHDLAQSRGAELTIDGRYGTALRTSAMLAFASVKGEHSLPEDVFRGRQSREGEVLLQEERLDWDKPWRGSLSANWSFGPDDRPRVLGLGLWNNWNLNFSFWAEAGKRYTPYTDSG